MGGSEETLDAVRVRKEPNSCPAHARERRAPAPASGIGKQADYTQGPVGMPRSHTAFALHTLCHNAFRALAMSCVGSQIGSALRALAWAALALSAAFLSKALVFPSQWYKPLNINYHYCTRPTAYLWYGKSVSRLLVGWGPLLVSAVLLLGSAWFHAAPRSQAGTWGRLKFKVRAEGMVGWFSRIPCMECVDNRCMPG